MPLGAITWAPGPRLRKSAIAADMPEPKTSVVGCAFERADDRLRLAHGLVVGAAVGIAAAIKIVGVALEGRGEMDRRHDRAGAFVDRPQRLGGEGARA